MRLIRGKDLTEDLQAAVKRVFIYRWTSDNEKREYSWHNIRDGKPTIPLITDSEWLEQYAFWVTARGELSQNKTHCEPAYMVENEVQS